ncbi:MAG TPA: HEAT repeat domain-containing protein [Pyrinomonadaceae bacterium]|nr:HEAT repeat domain-containing protein [Pyrinomonadaceae bacterium]
MGDNGNHPGVRAVEVRKRTPGSVPILILAGLFVAATFLAWYFSWFGRELSDADISKYLADQNNPRHVQHALLQIQQRIERGEATSKNWYPELIALSGSSETEFRLTVAWLMGFDNTVPQFHESLLKLVKDSEPIVRRNAALALVRFNDSSGHEELVSILKPYAVTAPAAGVVASSLREGLAMTRGTLLARIKQQDGNVAEVRSPLPGRIQKLIKTDGAPVSQGDEVLSLNSDENSIWEALRGLALIGTPGDVSVIDGYANATDVSSRVRSQAKSAINAIQSRTADLSK